MNISRIKEKKRLYIEKKKALQEEKAYDFLKLDKNLIDEYIDINDKNEFAQGLVGISSFFFASIVAEYIYTLKIDSDLKYDILNILTKGIDPIITDFKDPLYMYLTTMTLITYIFLKKSIELYYHTNKSKKYYEQREPKLKGYKYI